MEQEFDFCIDGQRKGREGGNAGLATLPLGSIMNHEGLRWGQWDGSNVPIQVPHGVARTHADAMRIPVWEAAVVAEDVVVCSRTIQRAPTNR